LSWPSPACAWTVGAAGPLAAGPTRFEIVNADGGAPEIAVAAPRPGVTLDAFSAALPSNPESAIEMVHSTAVPASRPASRAGP
jgi:hypothetical protein